MTQLQDIESLLTRARQHVQRFQGGGEKPSAVLKTHGDDSGLILDASFRDVIKRLIKAGKGEHENILAGEAYLRNRQPGNDITGYHHAANQLQDWVIDVISPTVAFAEEPPFAAESKKVASPEELARLVSMKETGLQLLSHLGRHHSPRPEASPSIVACLASFTDRKDPWTNLKAQDLAQSLLFKHLQNNEDSQSIGNLPQPHGTLIKDLLLYHVKPLFVKSKNPLLTAQARKAIAPLPGPAAPSDFESSSKPWKFESLHIVTIFQWILIQLNAPLVEAYWPLIIPPLLTILDDVSIKYKIKGCSLLILLLKVAPAALLERSGLGEIFQNTLMPYLLYLPSLTPVEESIPLLDAVYAALIALTNARYNTTETTAQKTKSLDSIFRYGILKGHAHAGENVRIATLLMYKSTDLINAMEIYCVKHLKDLLPLISATLTAPFATAYPPLVEAALQTLRAVIINGWPRVSFHKGEILEGLVICWCRIDDEEEPTAELLGIQMGIQDISRAVMRLLRDDERVMKEIQMIGGNDSRLKTLLEI